jgi:hypothetical protein
MNYVFMKASWVFTKFFGDDEYIRNMKAVGINPTRILNNDGSCSIIDSEGNNIATVSCQTKFKRGEGSFAECEERDANARLIAIAPSMYRLLKVWTQISANGGTDAQWEECMSIRNAIIEHVEGEA